MGIFGRGKKPQQGEGALQRGASPRSEALPQYRGPLRGEELLETAMERWGATVLRLAVARLGNRADAEDVFQTVFMRLLQTHVAFSDDEHLKAWLVRATLNCCIDARRSVARRRETALDETALENVPDSTVSRDASNEPGVSERLTAALAHLSEAQRTAVHLHYFEGYSTSEIAQFTGEAPGTVRSHLHRARRILRTEMGGAR